MSLTHRRNIGIALTIHLFAVAHAATAIVSRAFHYIDDVPLTLLTVSMCVIIALRRGIRTELTAAIILIACFLGYFLGTSGAILLTSLVGNNFIAPALITFIITEALGWGIYMISKYRSTRADRNMIWSPTTMQILIMAAAILLLRVGYSLIFHSDYFAQSGVYTEFQHLFSNTFALITLLCGNIILVGTLPRLRRHEGFRSILTIAITVLFSLVLTLVVYYNLPRGNNALLDITAIFRLYSVILLADIITFAALSLANYGLDSRAQLRTERGKKHHAQFQYSRLKEQINPHFLFNSLNILDFLVQEQDTDHARAFIHKLAGIYRYMLKNEDELLVPISEELNFAGMYIDLLKERFPNGFTIDINIPQPTLQRHVVPCSLQLLIENATKHNIVSSDTPLIISITTEDDLLVVSNNYQPRISTQASTHKGLANIRQQYIDIAGREIEVQNGPEKFIVKLPLL